MDTFLKIRAWVILSIVFVSGIYSLGKMIYTDQFGVYTNNIVLGFAIVLCLIVYIFSHFINGETKIPSWVTWIIIGVMIGFIIQIFIQIVDL